MIYLIAVGAFLSTLLGGAFALKYRDKLHLILGFSAGAVIGVAFFDLIPESIELGEQWGVSTVTSLMALGFVLFMILSRFLGSHSHDDDHECENENHKKGSLGAGSLSFHSFLDGIAVGLAFQVSSAAGVIVAIAVLCHNFSDGINTVGIIFRNGGNVKQAFKWLLADAAAPVLGIIVGSLISVSESVLGLILSIICGFFIYLGASDLLPESHHKHSTYWTTIATVVGIVFIYFVIKFAGV